MVWQSEPDGISEHRQWSAHIRMRIYTGAAEAQNAMMQKLSSPLISALPASPPALPYGQRIPGVGDVCFGSVSENGRGNIDCVTSNIWLTIKGGPEQASRDVSSEEDSDDDAILSISKLFVEKLHEADRETRAAEADGSRQAITFDFSRIKYDRRAREWVKAEKAPGRLKNEVEFENRENPESIIIRAMRSEGAPELVYEWAAVEGGRVRNEGMQQIQKMAIRLMSGEPGPRKVHYLAQYEDGSFEIVEDILVVHSSD